MGVLDNLKKLLISNDVGIGADALASERLAAHISAAKQELRAYAIHARRLRNDAAKLRQEADMWRRRAESAVASGRDDLAREALKRSFSLERDADELERRWTEDESAIRELADTVRLVGQRARANRISPASLEAFGEFERMSSRLETNLAETDLEAQFGEGAQDLSDAALTEKIEQLEASRQASKALDRLKSQAAQARQAHPGAEGATRNGAAQRRGTHQGQSPGSLSDQDPDLAEELDSIRRQLTGASPPPRGNVPDESAKDDHESGV